MDEKELFGKMFPENVYGDITAHMEELKIKLALKMLSYDDIVTRNASVDSSLCPIVDKEYRVVIEVNGGHRMLVQHLGRVHAKDQKIERLRAEEASELFFSLSGYYWSSSTTPRTLMAADFFRPNPEDIILGARYQCSFLNR